MVKSLEFVYFLFQSYNKCFRSEMFSVLVESYSISLLRLQHAMQKALFLFLCGFFLREGGRLYAGCIDHLFDNLESGKRNYRLGEKSRKVLNFGSKNLYEPW